MSNHQEQIIAAAAGKIVDAIGGKKVGNQNKGADAAGMVLGNPGAVAVTAENLLTMQVKVSFMGQIKDVTEVLSSVPLTEVDSLEVKRMGAAGVMEISTHGSTFKLEGKAGDMKEFASAFDRARAAG